MAPNQNDFNTRRVGNTKNEMCIRDRFDVVCNVAGGGVTGQAGAIRHGLSRALLQYDPELRPALKQAGFLTRDPRMKDCLLYTSRCV